MMRYVEDERTMEGYSLARTILSPHQYNTSKCLVDQVEFTLI